MRAIFILCGVLLLLGVMWVFQTWTRPEHYGAPFSGAPMAAVADVIASPEKYLRTIRTLEGIVANQCPTTGCYFFFVSGQKMLRVELGDIASKIPRKVGHRVRVEGWLVPYGDSYQFLGSAAEFDAGGTYENQ